MKSLLARVVLLLAVTSLVEGGEALPTDSRPLAGEPLPAKVTVGQDPVAFHPFPTGC